MLRETDNGRAKQQRADNFGLSVFGFTLWELLVAILVIGMILGMGVPNFATFINNGRMSSAVNSIVSALHLSRTEAVKRQATVTVCRSTSPLSEVPLCDGGSGGFIAFVDSNDLDMDGIAEGNGLLDSSDDIILRRAAPAETINLFTDGGYIAYGPNGFVTQFPGLGSRVSNILFCDARGNLDNGLGDSVARVVTISGTGRPQLLISRDAVATAATITGGACP